VIDVYVSKKRNIAAARQFFTGAITAHGQPVEVVADMAAALANVIETLIPTVFHNAEQYANNHVGRDYGRLKRALTTNQRPQNRQLSSRNCSWPRVHAN
jgi:transposase, IS6 family